jgi:uncharacterized membrane protein YidH (DUF202 family)
MHPIETGNIVLIILGVALVVAGFVIIYRTVTGMIRIRKETPTASLNLFSNLLNVIIAGMFIFAGVLFVINNLRGNPLHLKAHAGSNFSSAQIRIYA